MPQPRVISWNLEANSQKFLAGMNRAIAKQDEAIRKLREQNRVAKRTGSTMRGFTSQATSQFATLAAGIAAASRALSNYRAVAKGALNTLKDTQEGFTRFVSISNGDPKKLAGLIATSKELSRREGIPIGESNTIVFNASSLGTDNKEILRLGRLRALATHILPLATAGPQLRSAFGPEILGGTNKSAVNAIIQAAVESKITPEELAKNVLTTGASGSKLLKGTKNAGTDVLTALSVTTKAVKNPEVAATGLSRLFDILGRGANKDQFRGKEFRSTVHELANLSIDELDDIIGENIRADRAVGALLKGVRDGSFDKIRAATQAAIDATGTNQDLAEKNIKVAAGNQELSAARGLERATESRKLTELGTLAIPKARREQGKQILEEFFAKVGPGGPLEGLKGGIISRALANTTNFLLDSLAGPEDTIAFLTQIKSEITSRDSPDSPVFVAKIQELIDVVRAGKNQTITPEPER